MFLRPALIDAKKHPALFAELPEEQRGQARLKVVDPFRRDHLPEEGREVADHHYWHRRLRDGDVVPCSKADAAALAEAARPHSKEDARV